MSAIDERRRTSFDEKAAQYDATRPTYPDVLVREVIERTGARRVLEVGAGTGQATTAFARAGCEVVALEPGPRLASILRAKAVSLPRVTVEAVKFEDWSSGGRPFDLVVAAQSFHWVDPARRFELAARTAPHLALLTNEKDPFDPDLRADLDAAYSRWTGGDGNDSVPHAVEIARKTATAAIDASGLYGPVHVGAVPWQAAYSTREYLDLIDTYSDHSTLDAPRREGLYAAIGAAIDRHGGRVVVPYVAMAFVASVLARVARRR